MYMKLWKQGQEVINATPVLGRGMVTPKFFFFSLIIYTFRDKLLLMNELFFSVPLKLQTMEAFYILK